MEYIIYAGLSQNWMTYKNWTTKTRRICYIPQTRAEVESFEYKAVIFQAITFNFIAFETFLSSEGTVDPSIHVYYHMHGIWELVCCSFLKWGTRIRSRESLINTCRPISNMQPLQSSNARQEKLVQKCNMGGIGKSINDIRFRLLFI